MEKSMSNQSNTMSKHEYRKAQNHLVEKAMEGDLCSIEVYPAQNMQLWFMPSDDRALCMIHRWIFFSDHINNKAPEDRVFSIYTYANLLLKAINARLAPHPHRDILDYVEERLIELARLNVVNLMILPNGNIGVCIKSSKQRPASIKEGITKFSIHKAKKSEVLTNQISLLDKCLTLSTSND